VIPAVILNDGTAIPQLGFGTLLISDEEIIDRALDIGYRHLDTAQLYGNEEFIGKAIARSGIPRDELYLTSKLGNDNHRPDAVRRSFDITLDKLGLDYLDLFLMHWPLPTRYGSDYVSTWRAMTSLLADGRLRTAGVSNFQPAHLDRIIAETGIVPAVNQIEAHPYFPNDTARAASARHGIAVQAWRPLGRGAPLDEPVIHQLAVSHGKSSAQIILRWHIQRGDVIFPKTTRPERMKENLGLFNFELSAEQAKAIDTLDQGPPGRIGPDPDTFNGTR
jgi:2,5-diketo-D-gluconate reductase A